VCSSDLPLTLQLVAAQLDHSTAFFDGLGVRPRADWPPPLYDDDAMVWLQDRLQSGEDPSWLLSAVIVPAARDQSSNALTGDALAPDALGCVVGVAGFKGAPDRTGEVELGYSIVAAEQRKGYGSESVAGLLSFAFADPRVKLVSAHTLYTGVTATSRRVLEKAGFDGPLRTDEADVVRYELRRARAV